MNIQSLSERLLAGEDSSHQFKTNFTSIDHLAVEIAAFANSQGGSILVGIDDHGEVVGLESTEVHRLNQWISNATTQKIEPPLFVSTETALTISLDSLADIACVSKTYLAHLFRTRLGISPLRFLHQVRIEAAKRLLGTSQLPVREVAAQVGFSDPLYFSRAFRQATGLSPRAYRQQPNSTT